MFLCCSTCVSVMTCLFVVGPGSVDVNGHFLFTSLVSICWCVTVLQALCQCFDWCQCFRPCVIFTRHCTGDTLQVCSQVTVLHALVQCTDVTVLQALCWCVGAASLQEAVDRCLCQDRMPSTADLHTLETPARQQQLSALPAVSQLTAWWRTVLGSTADPNMSDEVYDRLLAR